MEKRARAKIGVKNPYEGIDYVADVMGSKNPYFTAEKSHIQFTSSGCTLLDCALGGGYPLGRIVNIVGDKSTAKTGLACEAIINFTLKYPKGAAAYRECESAFDKQYAAAMGMPTDKVDFGNELEPLSTVEAFAKDLEAFVVKQSAAKQPGIYVLDSLDALSDDAEMEADFGKATYGTAKAKAMSAMFRRLKTKVEQSKVLLIIVSQVRDNIGSMYEKHKRSGGRALDFYASQIIYLTHLKTLKRTVKKIERPVGIHIGAKVRKNKVGLPLREAEFDFLFGFGIDDIGAGIDWLKDVGRLDAIGQTAESLKQYRNGIETMPPPEYAQECVAVANRVKFNWAEVETTFLPQRRKYA